LLSHYYRKCSFELTHYGGG